MEKLVKNTGRLGCIGAIAIFVAIYCLRRTQNRTLLVVGIVSAVVAVASIGGGALLVRKYIKNKYR